MKKDTPFKWTENQQTAFEAIKTAVTTAPVLVHPDLNQPFIVEADASAVGYGAILSQDREGKLHPIAFISRSFNPAQRNYPTYDRELHAIVGSFQRIGAISYSITTPRHKSLISRSFKLSILAPLIIFNEDQTRYAVELGESTFAYNTAQDDYLENRCPFPKTRFWRRKKKITWRSATPRRVVRKRSRRTGHQWNYS